MSRQHRRVSRLRDRAPGGMKAPGARGRRHRLPALRRRERRLGRGAARPPPQRRGWAHHAASRLQAESEATQDRGADLRLDERPWAASAIAAGWRSPPPPTTWCAWPGSRPPRRRRSAPSGRSGSPQKHPEPVRRPRSGSRRRPQVASHQCFRVAEEVGSPVPHESSLGDGGWRLHTGRRGRDLRGASPNALRRGPRRSPAGRR